MTDSASGTSLKNKRDLLMQILFQSSKGSLQQTLVANYRLADALQDSPPPASAPQPHRLLKVARFCWHVVTMILPQNAAFHSCGWLWAMAGIPAILVDSLKLHPDAFLRQGPASSVILLRTGVANEPRIASWISSKEGEAVQMLQLHETAALRVFALRNLPRLLALYLRLCRATINTIAVVLASGQIARHEYPALIPVWLTLLARQAPVLGWHHVWAELFLDRKHIRALYFTMNYATENAFRLALPQARSAYVEHGFPRRHLPPLPCRQLVYSQGYADTLLGFDNTLEVEVIGLQYFDTGHLDAQRVIVIASLQDWPQFGIHEVADAFNEALAAARRNGWRLVFRTRSYDTDAFANALDGPWDDISKAANESFAQCLLRTRPAMVWTTWSTAVLDARAFGISPVAFVSAGLEEHFITDLPAFARVITTPPDLDALCESLACLSPSAPPPDAPSA